MKNTYLSIDTTTEACSVAINVGGDTRSLYTEEPRKHADLVLPMVDELLVEAGISLSQLDGIAFCRGPGAFTGLRIGAGVVQGLAFSADLPVLSISTLATMAQRTYREFGATDVFAAIDARMGELYWGSYILQDDYLNSGVACMILQGDEVVVEPHKVSVAKEISNNSRWVGCGTGWTFRDELLKTGIKVTEVYNSLLPHAVDALTIAVPNFEMGKGESPEFALPHYVRNNVAKKKSQQGS